MMKEFIVESTPAKRILIVTDVHNCHLHWYDTTTCDRLNFMCQALCAEYEKRPFDCILSLGDYSLDFWQHGEGGSYLWEKPVSNTQNFVQTYVEKLPKRLFMLPGNHEQYGDKDWEKITGYPREYAVVYGNNVFVMADTFGGNLDPKHHHDGVYTGVNPALLTEVLRAHPDKKIFLCAHDFIPALESPQTQKIICENKQIVCAFTGHTHRDNTVILSDEWRNMPVFYCGDFSYNLARDREKNWGYRTLDFKEGVFSTEYVRCLQKD